jgi:hypothetical protein
VKRVADITAHDINWTPAPLSTGLDGDDLIVEVMLDAQSYRELACAALHHIQALTAGLERSRAAYRQLLDEHRRLGDECRRLRVHVMTNAEAVR